MEDLVESLTRGNVTEVKVLLASVVVALAGYQLFLIAVGYGKLRLPFLAWRPASSAHRAVGDAILVLIVATAIMCISYYGFEEQTLHIVAAIALLAVLALKVTIIRRWHSMSRLLPGLGLSVFVLLVVTWASSAGSFLAD